MLHWIHDPCLKNLPLGEKCGVKYTANPASHLSLRQGSVNGDSSGYKVDRKSSRRGLSRKYFFPPFSSLGEVEMMEITWILHNEAS